MNVNELPAIDTETLLAIKPLPKCKHCGSLARPNVSFFGDFIFNDNYKVQLSAGDILMFPSNFIYKHKVTTVLKHTRYSFVCWGY